jgi:excisionase family DNA binding protein
VDFICQEATVWWQEKEASLMKTLVRAAPSPTELSSEGLYITVRSERTTTTGPRRGWKRADGQERRDMDRLLDKKAAADLLGISVRTLDRMRSTGQIKAVKVRGAVRFQLASLQNYIARQTRNQ